MLSSWTTPDLTSGAEVAYRREQLATDAVRWRLRREAARNRRSAPVATTTATRARSAAGSMPATPVTRLRQAREADHRDGPPGSTREADGTIAA